MAKKGKQRRYSESEEINERLRSNVGRLLGFGSNVFADRVVAMLRGRGHEGIRVSHSAVLRNMNSNGTRITELARRAGITKQAMGQLVREMRDQGYLDLATDPVDRRAKQVTYTKAGYRLAQDAADSVAEVQADFKAALGKGGLKELRKLLTRLVDEFADG